MFTGYFDASGSEGSTVAFVVGGYISTVKSWTNFSVDWRAALGDIEFFHMKEFAHSVGQFKGWKGLEQKRKSFLAGLIKVINKHTLASFASAVIQEDYAAVNREYPLREIFGSPYSVCGESCLGLVDEWRNSQSSAPFPEMIFESGDRHKGELMQVFQLWGLDPPVFRDKCKVSALQTGDLVAYENLKAYKNVIDHQVFEPRQSLLKLQRRPHFWKVLDMKGLMGIVDDMRLPERSAMRQTFLAAIQADRGKRIKATEAARRRRAVP